MAPARRGYARVDGVCRSPGDFQVHCRGACVDRPSRHFVRGRSLGEFDEHPSPNVLVIDEAPYELLFAHAAAVVHHGGVGTLAAVLRAGKPSIILPQVACQYACSAKSCCGNDWPLACRCRTR